ncbi:MAG: DUF2817 domain-containing protein [Candidatus Vogelbacteria bacterium]|nr:DUF2817 domain-containing protein [Candidatus Vogelbacteria bacterium]
MVISGTHGVEGPAGYNLQINLLEDRVHEKLPKDVGLVFVVALNPWGWANGRRTNEDNVDLNRNGWGEKPPVLPSFDPEINVLVHPERCNEEWYRELTGWLTDPERCRRLRAEVFRGQYDNQQGIFYGGRERAWSLKQLQWYCYHHLKDSCRHLVILDIHTGIGEWGEITLISSLGLGLGDDEALSIKRIKSWFGLGPVFPNLGQTETINAVSSDLLTFVARCLPQTKVTPLAIEIGTVPFETSFPVFVAENFCYLHHQVVSGRVFLGADSGSGWYFSRDLQPMLQEIFYPSVIDGTKGPWSVASRAGFMPIFRTVVRGLTES